MAACTGFTCDHCGFSVDFWDDGNRYLKWPPGPGTTCITRAISLRPRNLCRRSMDGRLPLRNIPKLSKATAVTRANFCANSVPASVASIQKGIVKSARCAASTSVRHTSGLAKTQCPKCPVGHFDCGTPGGIS